MPSSISTVVAVPVVVTFVRLAVRLDVVALQVVCWLTRVETVEEAEATAAEVEFSWSLIEFLVWAIWLRRLCASCLVY